MSNSELGSWLFIRAGTVHYRLHKVFAKLAINPRSQIEVFCPTRRPRPTGSSRRVATG